LGKKQFNTGRPPHLQDKAAQKRKRRSRQRLDLLNISLVPRDRIELPTRGFSVEFCKIQDCQHFNSLIPWQILMLFLDSLGFI
jgi:hypothetical protein